jgi:hypothetical protein
MSSNGNCVAVKMDKGHLTGTGVISVNVPTELAADLRSQNCRTLSMSLGAPFNHGKCHSCCNSNHNNTNQQKSKNNGNNNNNNNMTKATMYELHHMRKAILALITGDNEVMADMSNLLQSSEVVFKKWQERSEANEPPDEKLIALQAATREYQDNKKKAHDEKKRILREAAVEEGKNIRASQRVITNGVGTNASPGFALDACPGVAADKYDSQSDDSDEE